MSATKISSGFVGGALIPGMPHLLAASPADSWRRLAAAVRDVGAWLTATKPDVVVTMSTQWFTVLGHQFQCDPHFRGSHTDENWYAYDFGHLDYDIALDLSFTEKWAAGVEAQGLQARRTHYDGFPIDTGTIVASNLLDPNSSLRFALVSCNLYADPDAMRQIGRAAAVAADELGMRYAVLAVSGLSSGLIQRWIEPDEDRIEEPGHNDWNLRVLDLIEDGDYATLFELGDTYSREAQVDSQLRALPFVLGAGVEACSADVLAYGPIWGTGNAVVKWAPEPSSSTDELKGK